MTGNYTLPLNKQNSQTLVGCIALTYFGQWAVSNEGAAYYMCLKYVRPIIIYPTGV